jgi:hypothetical protein
MDKIALQLLCSSQRGSPAERMALLLGSIKSTDCTTLSEDDQSTLVALSVVNHHVLQSLYYTDAEPYHTFGVNADKYVVMANEGLTAVENCFWNNLYELSYDERAQRIGAIAKEITDTRASDPYGWLPNADAAYLRELVYFLESVVVLLTVVSKM